MNTELWIRLRRLQTNTSHSPHRGVICAALEAGHHTWWQLCESLVDRVDLDGLWRSAPEPEGQAEAEAERLLKQGMLLLTPGLPDFPERWLATEDPPLTLTVRGSLAALTAPSIAVVGSREPSHEGLRWMETQFAQFCRESRSVVVSGGARGVDQKAHAVALRAGTPTVMILPSGIECPYPADLSRWFNLVFEGGGAVVSEYPGRSPMRKANFHNRNRLIAAAGKVVLVVEARERSGTLITAARAADIGRTVLVLPGHPTDPRFAGNLALLKENATLILQCEDLLDFWRTETDPGLNYGHG